MVLRFPKPLAIMLKALFPDKKLVAVSDGQDKVVEEGLLKRGGPGRSKAVHSRQPGLAQLVPCYSVLLL